MNHADDPVSTADTQAKVEVEDNIEHDVDAIDPADAPDASFEFIDGRHRMRRVGQPTLGHLLPSSSSSSARPPPSTNMNEAEDDLISTADTQSKVEVEDNVDCDNVDAAANALDATNKENSGEAVGGGLFLLEWILRILNPYLPPTLQLSQLVLLSNLLSRSNCRDSFCRALFQQQL